MCALNSKRVPLFHKFSQPDDYILAIVAIIFIAVFTASAVYATAPKKGNTKISSFQEAKQIMANIYTGHEQTLYCGCRYSGQAIDLQSCGYDVKNNFNRARRLEWEHVVPASLFGKAFREWHAGHTRCVSKKGRTYRGRRCVRKVSRQFQFLEADLYNLYPAVGEVNGLRSNFAMALLPGEPREFGSCDVEIKDKKIEPRPSIRGDIARTYFYMNWAYPNQVNISHTARLLKTWDRKDPVDNWERERTERIKKFQGNSNPFISGLRGIHLTPAI